MKDIFNVKQHKYSTRSQTDRWRTYLTSNNISIPQEVKNWFMKDIFDVKQHKYSTRSQKLIYEGHI